ncbi:deoxyribonuclease V [Deltaproteobacteria bacterium IMCC39524]|nr:deoxyribonuclease V [Deltaproteobacteria bacterium IMCC39524]
MKFSPLHSWNLSTKEAIALQKELAKHIVLHDFVPVAPRVVAGVDVSYAKIATQFHAAVVLLDYASMEILETAAASGDVNFPYVPGLLSFRELPILLQAFRKLKTVPNVILVDAQGIAHPRRLGLASHLGLWLDLPTIGCAKSRLCGEFEEPAPEKGAWTSLRDGEESIGRVLRTKNRVKPLYISPGHKIDCRRSGEIVLQCGRGYRLPEPTRQAHLLSNRVRLQKEACGG